MPKLAYVDSSVALKLALDEPLTAAAKRLLRRYQRSGYRLISSELLRLEVRRVLFREFGSFTGARELVSRFALVRLIPPILAIAERMEHPIRSLDAIHVATPAYLDEPELVMISHDDNMKTVATALGLRVAELHTGDQG